MSCHFENGKYLDHERVCHEEYSRYVAYLLVDRTRKIAASVRIADCTAADCIVAADRPVVAAAAVAARHMFEEHGTVLASADVRTAVAADLSSRKAVVAAAVVNTPDHALRMGHPDCIAAAYLIVE